MEEKNQRINSLFYIIIAFLILAFFGLVIRFFMVTPRDEFGVPRPSLYSTQNMLDSLWYQYKKEFIEPGSNRTIDRKAGNITTSEGQSYTMLRAVWMDDQLTFDRTWRWTKDNLRREEDWLLSWLFGERSDGTYGVLIEQGGYNTASDANTDIALALVLAYARWQRDQYLNEAREIIGDIWEEEVVIINGQPYLTANNLENDPANRFVLLNPSYFAPYAYKIFAVVDPEHDWEALVDTSYQVINDSLEMPLRGETSIGLPPDWIAIDQVTGELVAPPQSNLEIHYGYEAMRIPWRLALDWQWFTEPRAKRTLERMSFLGDEWKQEQGIHSIYGHDGKIVEAFEPAAAYGTVIGYFMVTDPDLAKDVYEKKLLPLYDRDQYVWSEELGYYNSNWAWFGIALYNNFLKNYTSI